MKKDGIQYGSNEQYHFMCRYFSGFFMNHPSIISYDYYWRLEPNVKFMCNIDFDPFSFLRENNKLYGYVILHTEIMKSIPTLWKSTQHFITKMASQDIIKNTQTSSLLNSMLSLDGKEYTGCHYWSNFEIASFEIFRSKEYLEYFRYLDTTGGFFYERWGDAPIHTLALGMLTTPDKIHQFDNIAYTHASNEYCPVRAYMNSSLQCTCTPNINQQLSWNVCKLITDTTRIVDYFYNTNK